MTKHLWLVAIALLPLAGCTETTVRKETHANGRTTIQETTHDSHSDREAYQKEMKQHLDDLDKEMARWREKLDKAGAQAKEEMHVQLKNLEKQRAVVADRLHEMGRASEAAWGPMKEGFRKAFDDLKEAARQAREKFR